MQKKYLINFYQRRELFIQTINFHAKDEIRYNKKNKIFSFI